MARLPGGGTHLFLAAALFVAPLALLPTPRSTAAQELAGTWEATWAQAVRYQGGEMEIQRWGTAALELVVDGEAVAGTWTTHVLETVQWTVRGTLRGDALELVSTEHDSANPDLDIVEEMRWRGVLADGRLEGEMTMVFRGRGGDLRWRPWSAVRAGGAPLQGPQQE